TGLVLDSRRSPRDPIERTAFRPDNPAVRLTVSKEVDMHLLRRDAPRRPAVSPRPAGTFMMPPKAGVVVMDPSRRPGVQDGRLRDEIIPGPRDGSEGPAPTL